MIFTAFLWHVGRDTVASIAAANGITPVALLIVNPQISNPNAPLTPGSVVTLP